MTWPTSLDRVLAACEDLVNSSQNDAATLGRLELTAISHTLKARRSLQELWVDDDALSDQVALFLAGTGGFSRIHERAYPTMLAQRNLWALTNVCPSPRTT